MAEQEKDNTLAVVVGVTLIAVAGVLWLKADETKHLNSASGQTTAQEQAQVLSKHKDFNNNVLEQAK